MASTGRTTVYLLGILVTILMGWVLYVAAGILQPLVIALLLAAILEPVVRLLARWRIPPAVTVVLLVVLLFYGLANFGIILQENIAEFAGSPAVPAASEPMHLISPEQEQITREVGGWDGVVENLAQRLRASALPPAVAELIVDSLEGIDVRGIAAGLIGGGLGFTKGLLLVMLYMIFIFAEQAVFRRKILYVAGQRREETREVMDHITRGIQRYLGVKTLVSLLTGTLAYLLLVALDVPFALLFGILTFLLNYIPTFGSIIAAIFPTFTALAVPGATWMTAFLVVAGYLTINFVLGSLIEPQVLGRELNISPLIIVISVVVWGGIWGVIGAFLAVPLTSTVQIVLYSQERTRPVAILLSGGPPRGRPPGSDPVSGAGPR